MLWKKLAIVTAAGAALGTAAPAFADGWKHENGRKHQRYSHYDRHGHGVVVVHPRPAYHHYYDYAPPRPVVVYPAPAPVYYGPAVSARVDGDLAVIGGAVIGAVVGAHIGDRISHGY
jgi:uncharacterized protein YcfJ